MHRGRACIMDSGVAISLSLSLSITLFVSVSLSLPSAQFPRIMDRVRACFVNASWQGNGSHSAASLLVLLFQSPARQGCQNRMASETLYWRKAVCEVTGDGKAQTKPVPLSVAFHSNWLYIHRSPQATRIESVGSNVSACSCRTSELRGRQAYSGCSRTATR